MKETIRRSNDCFIISTFGFSFNATNNFAEVANSVAVACASVRSLSCAKVFHAQMLISGRLNIHNVVSWTALVSLYIKYGTIQDGREVFDKMPKRNLCSWNVMIAGYSRGGNCEQALNLYYQMRREGLRADNFTFPCLVKVCGYLGYVEEGRAIHRDIKTSAFDGDVFVGNALVAMYAKCGITEDARKVFDKMSERNVISWTALIAGYVQNNEGCKALKVFRQMLVDGIRPDSIAMASLLPVCAELRLLEKGKEIHAYLMKNEFDWDVSVGNALMDMYAKCYCVKDARQVFDNMFQRDVVSWNVMIAACAQNGYCDEAFELFCKTQVAGVEPDPVTISSILPACAQLAALQQGKEIHNYIFRRGFESDIFVGNGIIDMYGKCGSIGDASLVFDRMSERDVVSWTAMIVGCGMHGYTEYALTLFEKMKQAGMKPNKITFTGLLSACSHGGLVDKGLQYFDCMCREYCIPPAVEHCACIVDLLGRAGHLDSAYDFIKNMPLKPTASVWGALHSACRLHCNVELGALIAERLYELEPENAANYVLMSNIYADAGRWDDVANIRELSKERGLKTRPGCSWVETRGSSMHVSCVGDR